MSVDTTPQRPLAVSGSNQGPSPTQMLEDALKSRLGNIKKLKDKDLIDETEYKEQKAEVLRIHNSAMAARHAQKLIVLNPVFAGDPSPPVLARAVRDVLTNAFADTDVSSGPSLKRSRETSSITPDSNRSLLSFACCSASHAVALRML